MVNCEPPTRLEGKYAAIVVCWLLGCAGLFPWNSMLTIEDYYIHLFPKYHPPRVLTLVYQPFAFGTLAILAYNEAKISTRLRNIFGYSLFFVTTLVVLILDLATSGKGGIGTFIGICAVSGAFGIAEANTQGGMVGDLSYMLPEFVQSFLAGGAASGCLTSALRLITKAAFENSKDGLRKGAILFFTISTIFELLCVFLYAFVFPKLPIVKYYRSKAASEGSKTVAADLAASGIQAPPEGQLNMGRRRKLITVRDSRVQSNEVRDNQVQSNESSNAGKKKTRGYTHMLDVWDMPDGELVCVETDGFGNPIGWEGKTLLNAIGSLVRRHQCAPINYLSWKDMPESYINNMFDLIQSKFEFVPKLTEETKKVLKNEMNEKWKQFKHDLKSKGYDESKTEEEMASSIPDTRVLPSQYRELVHYWCSEKSQEISRTNKRNRSKYEDLHCMGSRNLPRLINEMTIEAEGVQPSRAQIYIDTRTRKDGSIVTEKAASVIDELKKHMELEASSGNALATQQCTNWKNDIYSKVKGRERRGRVRCVGKLPQRGSSKSNGDRRVKKLESLVGDLVAILQVRFAEDPQVNAILQAVAQEVSTPAPAPTAATDLTTDSN